VDALTLFQRAARDRDPHERGVGHQHGAPAAAEVERKALGSRNTSSRPSLLAKFSFDYQDLLFTPVAPAR
jgi:hypothetical protein